VEQHELHKTQRKLEE